MTSEFIKETLKKHHVVVFSKSYCPYCKKVKDLFDSLGVKYQSYELDEMDNGDAIQQELGKLTGATTVPRVFINGEFIGGCDDTLSLHKSGQLKKKLGL